MVSALDALAAASTALDTRTAVIDRLGRYYGGTQGISYLSPAALEAIGDRLRELPVNLVRVAVDVLAERLTLQGFSVGQGDDDAGLWGLWTGSKMTTGSAAVHLDSLLFGCGFVSVWTDPARRVRIRAESPRQCVVTVDPQTGEPLSAVKRWHAERRGRAVVFEPDRVTRLRTASETIEASGLPAEGWQVVDVLPNALGEVPVTPLPNRPRTGLPLGESEVLDAVPLVDALSKITQDMLVVSEAHSRPRRWATGLEVVEDDAGQPINPFTESPERVWQAEDPAVKFGEFDATSLDGFVAATGILLRQIAAVTAVPPAVLGLSSDAPASAEALRASESGLVARARARQVVLGEAWARVGRHALIAHHGVERPAFADVEVVWGDAESRSEIVSADRAAKLHALGVPLAMILDDLGWSPRQVEKAIAARRAEALETAGADLLRSLAT